MSDDDSTRTFMPFRPEFRDAVISGRKTVTTRTKKCAEPGDVLESSFGNIEIIRVGKSWLGMVRDVDYISEGCATPAEFERIWKETHPLTEFDPDQWVWMHTFRYLGESR